MLRDAIHGELIRRHLLRHGTTVNGRHRKLGRRDIYVPHRTIPFAGPLLGLLVGVMAWAVANWIGFNEGRNLIEAPGGGWPSTTNFDLSTNAVSAFTASSTQGGGYAVVTGTGYTTKTQSTPSPSGLGSIAFSALSWANGAATDWTSPKTIVARNNSASKLLCAWNINGGSAVDMSVANTTLAITPTYSPSNPS